LFLPYLGSVMVVVALVFLWAWLKAQPNESWRLARIERKLDLILEHLQVPYQEAGMKHVEKLVQQGLKIEAIRAYREETGVSLKAAKEAVERMAGGSST
jgi:ribosomal protein L7/L12